MPLAGEKWGLPYFQTHRKSNWWVKSSIISHLWWAINDPIFVAFTHGNQAWQWKMHHLWMVSSLKPLSTGDVPYFLMIFPYVLLFIEDFPALEATSSPVFQVQSGLGHLCRAGRPFDLLRWLPRERCISGIRKNCRSISIKILIENILG